MKIVLPLPPSVNVLFRNVPRVGRVKTAKYKHWRMNADTYFMSQRREIEPVSGPYRVLMRVPMKMRGDVDNRLKGPLDWLASRELTPDDRKCVEAKVFRCELIKDGECEIEVLAA